MPSIANTSALAFAPFFDEAAGAIAPDRSLIVCEHSQVDPVQLQRSEGMRQDQLDHLTTQPFAKLREVVEPDCQARPAVVEIKPVQTNLPQQAAIELDRPTKGMRKVPLHPCPGIAFLIWGKARRVASEAMYDFW